MNEVGFWKLLENAKLQSKGDIDEQERVIVENLSKLSTTEIYEFYNFYSKFDTMAYTKDLWAAHYLIDGGTSDDTFTDFRGWLIAQGENIFYTALQNPDILAEIAEPDNVDIFLFRLINKAYQLVSASNQDVPPPTKRPVYRLTGEDWDEESAKRKYPKLAQKFVERFG